MKYFGETQVGECISQLPVVRRLAVAVLSNGDELREPGRRTARLHYGARGFVAHHNTDLWRATTPVDGARWGLWPMGAAWLSTHLYEHYAFGGDPAFLRKAYPVLKEASEFLLDFLVEDEQGRDGGTRDTSIR